jgi:hypothetical protein
MRRRKGLIRWRGEHKPGQRHDVKPLSAEEITVDEGENESNQQKLEISRKAGE